MQELKELVIDIYLAKLEYRRKMFSLLVFQDFTPEERKRNELVQNIKVKTIEKSLELIRMIDDKKTLLKILKDEL